MGTLCSDWSPQNPLESDPFLLEEWNTSFPEPVNYDEIENEPNYGDGKTRPIGPVYNYYTNFLASFRDNILDVANSFDVAADSNRALVAQNVSNQNVRLGWVSPNTNTLANCQQHGPMHLLSQTSTTQIVQFGETSNGILYTSVDCRLYPESTALMSSGTVLYGPLNASEWRDQDNTFHLYPDGSMVFSNILQNFTGPIDPETGKVSNWNETAFGPSPVVSQVGWFSYQCAESQYVYSPPWYSLVFHWFPRITGGSFFVYQESSSFQEYIIGVSFTAVPFAGVALLLLFCTPARSIFRGFYKCFRRLCDSKAPKRMKSSVVFDDEMNVDAQRYRAKQLRSQILRKKLELDDTLRPSGRLLRFALIIMVLAESVIIPLGIYFEIQFSISLDSFNDGATFLSQNFDRIAFEVDNALVVSRLVSDNCTLPPEAVTYLVQEQRWLDHIGSIVGSQMVPITNNDVLTIYQQLRNIVWTLLNLFFIIIVVVSILSLLLTYFTFKWGNDKVLCRGASYYIGCSLLPLLIFSAVFAWLCLGVLCIFLVWSADLCFTPNVVVVDDSIANPSSSAEEQIEAHIYTYVRNYSEPGTPGQGENPYLWHDSPMNLTSRFNVGMFLTQCYSTNVLFNPYADSAQRANLYHEIVSNEFSLDKVNCSDPGAIDQYLEASELYYSPMLLETSCDSLTESFGQYLQSFCVDPGYFSIFLFWIMLMLFSLVALTLSTTYLDMMPNIHRITLATNLYKEIREDQAKLSAQLRGRNQQQHDIDEQGDEESMTLIKR